MGSTTTATATRTATWGSKTTVAPAPELDFLYLAWRVTMRSIRFGLLGAALSAACGGSSADPDTVAEDLAHQICELSFRCCSRGEVNFYLGPYVDQDDCVDRLVNVASLGTLEFNLGVL